MSNLDGIVFLRVADADEYQVRFTCWKRLPGRRMVRCGTHHAYRLSIKDMGTLKQCVMLNKAA